MERRELIANYPTGVLGMRLQANQPGQLNAKISLSRSQNVISNTASTNGGVNSIVLMGNSNGTDPYFVAEAQVITTGGKSKCWS